MTKTRSIACVATAMLCNTLSVGVVHAQDLGQTVVPLTDPARPAVVSIGTLTGSIVVRGTSRTDVLVRDLRGNDRPQRGQSEPPPGMRRLTPRSAFLVEEHDNEVTIGGCFPAAPSPRSATSNPPPPPTPEPSPRPSRPARPPFVYAMPEVPFISEIGLSCGGLFSGVDLQIEVPLKTRLRVSSMKGDITIENVDGVLEVNTASGNVSLMNVAGSVVAHSISGDVTAVLMRGNADAPMAFSTLSGKVDVTLPATIKASVKLRSDTGEMFTDFDFPAVSPRPPARGSRQPDGSYRLDTERAVVAPLNGGGPEIELRSFNGDTYLRKGR